MNVDATSISLSRSDATPPLYGVFLFDLEEKAGTDNNTSFVSQSSDTEDNSSCHPVQLSPRSVALPKQKLESQSQSLPINIPQRDATSPTAERATQSHSAGSDIYLDRARLSRELERVRAAQAFSTK
jgi:hypothetical protein